MNDPNDLYINDFNLSVLEYWQLLDAIENKANHRIYKLVNDNEDYIYNVVMNKHLDIFETYAMKVYPKGTDVYNADYKGISFKLNISQIVDHLSQGIII